MIPTQEGAEEETAVKLGGVELVVRRVNFFFLFKCLLVISQTDHTADREEGMVCLFPQCGESD